MFELMGGSQGARACYEQDKHKLNHIVYTVEGRMKGTLEQVILCLSDHQQIRLIATKEYPCPWLAIALVHFL